MELHDLLDTGVFITGDKLSWDKLGTFQLGWKSLLSWPFYIPFLLAQIMGILWSFCHLRQASDSKSPINCTPWNLGSVCLFLQSHSTLGSILLLCWLGFPEHSYYHSCLLPVTASKNHALTFEGSVILKRYNFVVFCRSATSGFLDTFNACSTYVPRNSCPTSIQVGFWKFLSHCGDLFTLPSFPATFLSSGLCQSPGMLPAALHYLKCMIFFNQKNISHFSISISFSGKEEERFRVKL